MENQAGGMVILEGQSDGGNEIKGCWSGYLCDILSGESVCDVIWVGKFGHAGRGMQILTKGGSEWKSKSPVR